MVTNSPDVSIIVPTYCEVENLPALIPQIDQALKQTSLRYEIVIVDDDSPDGTEDLCQDLSQRFPLRLITRRDERGLASAVVCGLRAALGKILVVMDADLSHPPTAIPDLVTACQSPCCDFSIGSRYVEGGSIDSNWTRFRHLNSQTASWLARGLTKAKDPMSGFFAIKRSTFIKAQEIRPLGYKIGLELLVRCDCRHVAEVPIAFRDRTLGNSKLTLGQQWLYLRHLGRLYPAKYAGLARIARFGLVGLSGMTVDLTSLTLLRSVLSFPLARALAIGLAMTWNFFLHRGYTFRAPAADSTFRQFGKFVGACLYGALVNWMVSMLVVWSLPPIPGRSLFAAALGVMAGSVCNYLFCQRLVFGQSRATKTSQVVMQPKSAATKLPGPHTGPSTQIRPKQSA